jgi:hypothetical protein
MSIAIYRHLKLTAAIPLEIRPTVLNHHPRRFRSLCIDQDDAKEWTTTIGFSHLRRQRELRLVHNEFWIINNGTCTVMHQWLRNGSLVKQACQGSASASTLAWTENGVIMPLYEQFENEISSQVVAERYLHQNVPNPYDYKIVTVDFDPKKKLLDRPQYSSALVRPPEAVEMAAKLDRSESAEKWAQLFFE